MIRHRFVAFPSLSLNAQQFQFSTPMTQLVFFCHDYQYYCSLITFISQLCQPASLPHLLSFSPARKPRGGFHASCLFPNPRPSPYSPSLPSPPLILIPQVLSVRRRYQITYLQSQTRVDPHFAFTVLIVRGWISMIGMRIRTSTGDHQHIPCDRAQHEKRGWKYRYVCGDVK